MKGADLLTVSRHWVFYRADYQKILYYTALAAGVQVLLGAPVESVDENGPSLILKTGQRSKGDLIVGADGIRSTVRQYVLPTPVDAVAAVLPNIARIELLFLVRLSDPIRCWHLFWTMQMLACGWVQTDMW